MKAIHYWFWVVFVASAIFFGSIEAHTNFLHWRVDPVATILIIIAVVCVWLLFYLFAILAFLLSEPTD